MASTSKSSVVTDLVGTRVGVPQSSDIVDGTVRAVTYDSKEQDFALAIHLDNGRNVTVSWRYVITANPGAH